MNISGIGANSGISAAAVPVNSEKKSGISQAAPVVPERKRDEYIPSEEDEPIGLYKPSEDEDGEPRIDYDAPEKKSEKCTCNTDKVDREIKNLNEKARLLRQQIKSASDDKRDELEKQLKEVEQELSQKDNDNYRRQHAEFSR